MWIASEDVSILILELNINDRIKPKFNYKCLLRASRQELKNPLGQAIKQVEAIITHNFGILLKISSPNKTPI